ncbi:hypothetical protein [Prosthecobacter sp.]|nr:hypothetical protein [Prosthecobacter sp.]MCB1278337.1 hypothetical protein [Prosthecobacter sp.]
MPTLMTSLDTPLRLRATPTRRPPHPDWWRWLTFVLGFSLGWILHMQIG